MNVTASSKSSGIGQAKSYGGQLKEFVGTMKYSAVYAAGGEELDLTSYFANGPAHVSLRPTGGYIFSYDSTTGKVSAQAVAATITANANTGQPSATGAVAAKSSIPFHGLLAPTSSATKYLGGNGAEGASAADVCPRVITDNGTLTGLFVSLGTAPGTGKTYSLTVVKNGVDTGLTVSITGTGKAGSDTTAEHAVSVVAGDQIALKSVNDDGAAAVMGASLAYSITAGTAAVPTATHTHSVGASFSSAALSEVADNTDLRSLVIPFVAYGY